MKLLWRRREQTLATDGRHRRPRKGASAASAVLGAVCWPQYCRIFRATGRPKSLELDKACPHGYKLSMGFTMKRLWLIGVLLLVLLGVVLARHAGVPSFISGTGAAPQQEQTTTADSGSVRVPTGRGFWRWSAGDRRVPAGSSGVAPA